MLLAYMANHGSGGLQYRFIVIRQSFALQGSNLSFCETIVRDFKFLSLVVSQPVTEGLLKVNKEKR